MAINKEVNIIVKETGLDEVNKKVNKLETSVESLEDQQRSLSKSMGDSSQSVLDNGGAMGLLNDATGGLAMTVKDAVEASWLFTKSQKAAAIQQSIATTVVGTSTGAMKAFRIALAATGIGLIVIGLGLLIANFDKVKKVVLAFVPGLAAVGEWFGKIADAVTDFIGVTSEAERALERFDKASQKRSDELDRKLAENGSAYSESAKKKMAIDAKLEEDLRKHIYNEVALRKEAQIAKDNIDKENAKKTADARKAEQDKINDENEKAKQKRIDDEKKEDERRLKKIKDDAEKAKEIDDEAKQAMADVEEQKNAKLEADEDKEAERGANKTARIKGEFDEQIAIEQEAQRQKEAIADANMKIATSTVNLLSQLAGKNKALQKAGIIASAGIGIYSVIKDTQAANMAAIAPPPLGLGPIAGIGLQTKNTIQGGLSIASISAASAKALASVGGGGSVSGGSVGGSGGSAPQAPSFNLVQGTSRNQIAEGLTKQAPVKAFVVSRDMSTGQELDRNIVASASL